MTKTNHHYIGHFADAASRTLVVGRIGVHIRIDVVLTLRPRVFVVHIGQQAIHLAGEGFLRFAIALRMLKDTCTLVFYDKIVEVRPFQTASITGRLKSSNQIQANDIPKMADRDHKSWLFFFEIRKLKSCQTGKAASQGDMVAPCCSTGCFYLNFG